MIRRAILLLSLIACASLSPSAARAGQAEPQSPPAHSGKAAADTGHSPVRATHQAPNTGNKAQPYTKTEPTPRSQRLDTDAALPHAAENRNPAAQPVQPANSQPTAPHQNAARPGQSSRVHTSPAAKSAPAQAGLPAVTLPVRPPAASAALPHSNERHRSPNPATIGGSLNNQARNAAVISGNTVHRKP